MKGTLAEVESGLVITSPSVNISGENRPAVVIAMESMDHSSSTTLPSEKTLT